MKARHLLFFLFCSASSFNIQADFPALENENQQLIVHNRILAKVNNKTISVLDVVKNMDVFLNRYYPQYANSNLAKYQYYSSQWKEVLLQMIDHELIQADAEKLELKISDAEIRETIIEKFGPNLMSSLDKLNLSYDEARKMIHSELVVQKMTWYRVHSKAMQNVNPQDIKLAYQDYCTKNPPKEQWEYQVLSIRAKNETIGQALAQKAYELLKQAPSNLPQVAQELKNTTLSETEEIPTISVSEEYKTDEKTISDLHKQALARLGINSISEPMKQLSRYDQNVVFRIFYLKNHFKTQVPSFHSMSDKLQDKLLQEAIDRESIQYIAKLRARYGFDAKSLDENIPSDFQPFSLK
jgi:hypothetical protein